MLSKIVKGVNVIFILLLLGGLLNYSRNEFLMREINTVQLNPNEVHLSMYYNSARGSLWVESYDPETGSCKLRQYTEDNQSYSQVSVENTFVAKGCNIHKSK